MKHCRHRDSVPDSRLTASTSGIQSRAHYRKSRTKHRDEKRELPKEKTLGFSIKEEEMDSGQVKRANTLLLLHCVMPDALGPRGL